MPQLVTASPSDLLSDLQSLVRTNTRLWKRLILLEMAAVIVAAPLAYLWIVFSLDMLVHLPRWGRILTSAAFFAVLIFLARWIWQRWRAVRLTEDEVALAIERQSPGSDNRLINSLQISRDSRLGGSEPGEALLRENHASLQRIQLSQAAKSKPAALRLAAAFGVVAIGVAFFVLRPDHFSNAAARLFQPFAEIAPLYRTTLTIEPGDLRAQPGSTVTIRAVIQGETPDFLTVKQRAGEQIDADRVTVKAGAEWVEYTFPNVQRTLTYTVSAGDFTTPQYTIEVPRPPRVNLVRATLHPPTYTGLPSREIESHGGDLEALRGTRAEVIFVLDQDADTATLSREGDAGEPVALERKSGAEFRGEIVFDQAIGYRVEARREGDEEPGPGAVYALRVLPDQAPWLTMRGLEKQMEALPGAEFPLKLATGDDYGVKEAGVFARVGEADWRPVKTWPLDGKTREWALDHTLPVSELGAVEGDRVEIALRARDADPAKGDEWTTGESAVLLIGGEGAQFSVLYEQILKSEQEIAQLIVKQQESVAGVAGWIQKLDPASASGFRLDDAKNLEALAAGMKQLAAAQEALRQTTGAVARDLVPATGNLRFSLAMLADAEMVRATRVIESVAGNEEPQGKRSALSEARFTQERTIRSLNQIYEQYVQFRMDWELANMTPFVKMLAERQAALGAESTAHAAKAPQVLVAKTAGQRQTKLHHLAGLAEVALAGVGERVAAVDELLGQAFTESAAAIESSGAKSVMQQAATLAAAGDWTSAARDQEKAAVALAAIHAALKKAGAEAIARAMKEADAKASELAAQKELGELMPGSLKASETFRQDLSKVSEVVEMRESAAKAREQQGIEADALPAVTEDLAARMRTVESSLRPDLSTLRLGDSAGATRKFNEGALPPNEMVAPLVPDKIEDLIGQLLDEADEMGEQFDTLTANSGLISADPGEVGKIAGRMNSSGATSTTGNKKPPTTNVGGMSATGRQGARSYGKVAGSESINRRGRDQVQEGQFAAPDQEGVMTEKKSEDMQPDQATGIGGKRVDSEKTKFSLSDKGEWDDKFADRMQKPQAVNTIVERQGKPLDPRVAAMLRDLEGDQEQLIERANALRKELKNLYLPTDHLDEMIAQLSQNLEKLRETPDAETFREQVELIDELRNEARVFNRAQSGFQPSLPRQQQVRGRILDEPAAPPVPGYEDAVKAYYSKLAAP